MKPFHLIVSFVFLFALNGHAQDYTTKKTVKGKIKKIWDKGMEHNMKGENFKAIREFEKALEMNPKFIDAQLQWAAV